MSGGRDPLDVAIMLAGQAISQRLGMAAEKPLKEPKGPRPVVEYGYGAVEEAMRPWHERKGAPRPKVRKPKKIRKGARGGEDEHR